VSRGRGSSIACRIAAVLLSSSDGVNMFYNRVSGQGMAGA
jgi:hypothetical protein